MNKFNKVDNVINTYVGEFQDVPSRSDKAVCELVVTIAESYVTPRYLFRYHHHEGSDCVFGTSKELKDWFDECISSQDDDGWRYGLERLKLAVSEIVSVYEKPEEKPIDRESVRKECTDYLYERFRGGTVLGTEREMLFDGVEFKGLNNMTDDEILEHMESYAGNNDPLYQRAVLAFKVDEVILGNGHTCTQCGSTTECEPQFCVKENG